MPADRRGDDAGAGAEPGAATTWTRILALAAAGTAIAVVLVLVDLSRTRDALGDLVVAGPESPAASVIRADLPSFPLTDAGAHDGQQYYAIARDLPDLDAAADHVDRSHYRLQRILFPALARVLGGDGGTRLVWTMFALGVVGVAALGTAAGALSRALGGPAWPALVAAALPGCLVSLRITVPDPFALTLVLWAVWLSLRERTVLAATVGAAAALTRETTLLVLAGVALWRRDRRGAVLLGVPTAATALWWLLLRVGVDQRGERIVEIVPPLSGWREAVDFWSAGNERLGALWMIGGVAVAVVALVRRGIRHPLGPAIAIQLALFVVLSSSAIAPERNASRTTLTAVVLAIVALAAPDHRPARAGAPPVSPEAAPR